ncbi:MAG: transcription initiation factor TFIID subunit 6 [Amphiamblys sp. WSBS2006]|nr:MAG: transcription initiation factor TFIID subunit 6 [Amphiamblys sp. WSBS2006]
MSIFPSASIEEYANTVGIKELPEDVARLLANDVEYRVRELVQDASKFMLHSKRTRMSVDDIRNAFLLRNIEPVYGYDPTDGFSFVSMDVKKKDTEKTVFYISERTVNTLDCLRTQPDPLPAIETFSSHWLAVEGIQPRVEENAAEVAREEMSVESASKPFEKEEVREAAVKKPLVQHTLTRELQLYFDAVEDAVVSCDKAKGEPVFVAVMSDAGIQQLVPYFTQLIADVVTKNLRRLCVLWSAVSLARSVLANRHLCVEPYLHQLLPSLLTCVVGKSLCEDVEREDHWALRRNAAELCAQICSKYGSTYETIVPRVTKTLSKGFHDREKPLTTHYGALYGLSCLSDAAVDRVVMPGIAGYVEWLATAEDCAVKERVVQLARQLYEAWRERGDSAEVKLAGERLGAFWK